MPNECTKQFTFRVKFWTCTLNTNSKSVTTIALLQVEMKKFKHLNENAIIQQQQQQQK